MLNSNLAHRKATCRLHVVDKDKNPVSQKKLSLKQTNHEFLFGCGAFDTVLYTNPEVSDNHTGVNHSNRKFIEERINKWLDVYNYGTLPFYWGGYEYVEGNPQFESRINAAKFLKEHNVTVKGHPLCWHTVCADWLKKYDNKTILEKQLARITREVSGFKGLVDMWDVINEVVIMPMYDRDDNAITRICKQEGRFKLIKECFDTAKASNPQGIFLLNDFNTSVSYDILIEGCLDMGVPITAIGIQSHQHQGYWGKEKLEAVLARFERFGLPIHFTENTLVSGQLIPPEITDLNDFHYDDVPIVDEYEERQKNEMEEMYRILFDHPLVKAVTGWDFGDGAWLNAPSGVLRKDNSEKPSYKMLKNLIWNEWCTDIEVITDKDGYVSVEGFKGDYTLSDSGTGKSSVLKLTSGMEEQNIILD